MKTVASMHVPNHVHMTGLNAHIIKLYFQLALVIHFNVNSAIQYSSSGKKYEV